MDEFVGMTFAAGMAQRKGQNRFFERIKPYLLKKGEYKDWGEAEVLAASHHGSGGFFDDDKDRCLENPKNKDALDYIKHGYLVVSSADKFPTSKDESGDDPPHFRAYKWYKKDLVKRELADKNDNHPERFLYTCEGNIRFEYGDDDDWTMDRDWSPEDSGESGEDEDKSEGSAGFTPRKRVSTPNTPRKFG